jgi:hypothetical protein
LWRNTFERSLITTLDTPQPDATLMDVWSLVTVRDGAESALERIVFAMAYTSDRMFWATDATSSVALCAPANVPKTK